MMMKKTYSLGRLQSLFPSFGMPVAIFGATVILSALGSCSKPDDATVESNTSRNGIIIIAELQQNSRTVLSGKEVLWTEEDTVGCLCYDDDPSRYAYTGEIVPTSIDGSRATFEINTKSGLSPKILVNPDADTYSLSSDGRVLVELPSEYRLVPGEVPVEGLVSAGQIQDGKVVMRNILSFMKFTIESEDITSFRINAGGDCALSGTLAFDPVSFEIVTEGAGFVKMVPADTSGVFAPGVYYAPVPAGTYPEGLSVKFFRKDGMAAKKTLESSYTIARNRFINMGCESDWNLEFLPASRKVDIIFSDGVTFKWNFSADSAAVTPMTMPDKKNDVIGKGRVGPYYPLGYPGVQVHFCVRDTSGSKSYFDKGANYGIRYGGSIGDYMTIPALKSYRMAGIVVTLGSKTAYYAITTDPADDSPEETVKLATFSGKNTSKSFSFTDLQTSPSTSYRISTTRTNETAIWSVEITYEIED